jgi:putative flippase GtrA
MHPLTIIHNKRLIRYLAIAVFIVTLELTAFQVIYLIASHNYAIATVGSFLFATVLNWILSRKVVFGASRHHPAKEFLMVLAASIFGVCIQLTVVWSSVTMLGLYPLIGKVLSIGFSFFWNYWFRAQIIYKSKSMPIEEAEVY